jgi:Kef-type K+ transport system membrane component KefB
VEGKIEAVAFGFLVPVFFISTGITFELRALLDDPRALSLVPVFLVLMLLVRGLPGLLAAPEGSSPADRRAIVLLSATGLPIIVAVTAIGVDSGLLATTTAAALVGAGMLSVLIFPLVALAQRPSTPAPHDGAVHDGAPPEAASPDRASPDGPAPGEPGAGRVEDDLSA